MSTSKFTFEQCAMGLKALSKAMDAVGDALPGKENRELRDETLKPLQRACGPFGERRMDIVIAQNKAKWEKEKHDNPLWPNHRSDR